MTKPPSPRQLASRLKLRHLELIRALGMRPNLHHVAAQLHMTQPTASKLLREIETMLGFPLFTRNRRGLMPTAYGGAMTRWANLILTDVGAAHDELVAISQGAIGRLRIGVFPVVVSSLLPEFIRVLRQRTPNLQLSVQIGLEDTLIPALSRGEIDCLLGRVVPEMLTSDLQHDVLYRERTVVVCGTHHPILELPAADCLSELSHAHWILPSRGGPLFNMIASRLARAGHPMPLIAVETTSTFVIVELLHRSELVSAVSLSVARSYADIDRMHILPIDLPDSHYPVGVAYRRDSGANEPLASARTAIAVAAKLLLQDTGRRSKQDRAK